jgi:hypothetical protein
VATIDLTPEEIAAVEAEPIDRALAVAVLRDGGYGRFTVRSKRTGKHVTIVLAAKKRSPQGYANGPKYLTRAKSEGRVGLADADAVFADTPEGEYVGRFERGYNAHWKIARNADANAAWTAKALLRWVTEEGYDLTEQADVMLAAACSRCHRELRHPESLADRMGPECSGRGGYASRHAAPRKAEVTA